MVRQIVAGFLAIAVQASAVTAPMVHVHLDDHDSDHHHAREMHSHLAGHPRHAAPLLNTHGPSLIDDDEDERVLAVSGFVATSADVFPGVAATPVETAVLIFEDVAVSRIPHVSHGHDPPELAATPSRAPPSFPTS